MKKNDIDFSLPRRQSKIAILLFILKTYRIIAGQVWPFLILFVLKGDLANPGVLLGLAALIVLATAFAILGYFRHTFHIKSDELIVESGVLRRKKLVIPFDRIQVVNFEQTIVHQVFEVVRLSVDTAGSTKEECKLDALEKSEAEALRQVLLSGRKSKTAVNEAEAAFNSDEEYEEKFTPIMRLSPGELLVAGIAENHLKSGGLILLFMLWITERLREFGLDVDEYTENLPEDDFPLAWIIILLVIFLVFSVIISLFRMVVRNFDLKFWRSDYGFKITAGLITTRMTSALDKKIQTLSWRDNLLKKIFGIHDLRLQQASSDMVTVSKAITIPGCRANHIAFVRQSLYKDFVPGSVNFEKPEIKMLYRQLFFSIIFSLILLGASYLFVEELQYVAVIALLYFSFQFWLQYRKMFFGLNEEMLIIKGGAFGDRTTMIPVHKIQSVELSRSFYQRRHGLASIIIYNASGSLSIRLIKLERAREIVDFVLYKVEKDNKDWM
jgi:putative membrane protein